MMTSCLNSHHFGVKCVWDNEKGICLPFSDMPPDAPSIDFESTYRYCLLKKLLYTCTSTQHEMCEKKFVAVVLKRVSPK